MKNTNFFYHLLIVLGLCSFMFCNGNGKENNTGAQRNDTAATDTASAATHVDPSTAYPQPPVTGSSVDSSRSKDTAAYNGKQGYKK